MDPLSNPFAPGAGNQPPALTGREGIITSATTALSRVQAGRPDRGQMLLGLRGVGKTVLLNLLRDVATTKGYLTILLEAPADGHLAELLAPPLRSTLLKLSTREKSKDLARRGLSVLRGFASAFKVSIGPLGFEIIEEPGTADSGSLEHDLPELLQAVGEAARADGTGVGIFIDEVQYLKKKELAALIVSLHRASQQNLPLLFFGAGLPQLAALAGNAKSYAERLFRYPEVGPLSNSAAAAAIQEPLSAKGIAIEPEALEALIAETKGYPYFLQEWGHHVWLTAEASPITTSDVSAASAAAVEQLDADFFRVRFDRLTPREKDYLRAMADIGEGPYESGAIAVRLSINVHDASPIRNVLIMKGMIYSPRHGMLEFTVPMFAPFMLRSMQDWTPGAAGFDDQSESRRSRRSL